MKFFSTYLREIVYGGADGIVTTFAVVAGFTGAQSTASSLPVLSVLLFGFANLFADATSMGLGNFLSVKSDQHAYLSEKKKKYKRISDSTEEQIDATNKILQSKGLSPEDAHALTRIFSRNKDYWLQFMMSEDLKLSNPTLESPTYTSLATFASFIFFGFIPLIPYILLPDNPNTMFLLSIFAAGAALTLLGILRSVVTQHNLIRSLLETLVVGGISATIAYFVGSLFSI